MVHVVDATTPALDDVVATDSDSTALQR